MKVCKHCGQQLFACFYRDHNTFCGPECADAFEAARAPVLHPAEQPFDEEMGREETNEHL